MADRSVRVRLEADISQYKRELAQSALITAGFARSVDKTRGPLTGMENDSRRAGAEIDRFSGRLRLAADAAAILGPALAPLGAAAVGGFVALSAQLGATVGALGVTVLAVNGLGDGLKALNAYQLDPTEANLKKLNEEMKRLGPSGQHFVEFLDGLGPELQSLQFAARDGLLPGAEEGIQDLMRLLPEVRTIISNTAQTLGDLSADAGQALSGGDFEAFFNYLKTDAVTILDATARTAGNLVEALANVFVAFAPMQGDFADALLRWSEGLAEASANLSTSNGFQEFVAYIEETGPVVIATMESLANALLQIVEAAAPLGGPILQALGGVANVLALIADSPIGPTILATVTALSLLNRGMLMFDAVAGRPWAKAIAGAEGFTAKLNASRGALAKGALAMAGLSLAASGAAEGIGLGNTATLALTGSLAGPWGAAAGGAIGLFMDMNTSSETFKASSEEVIGTLDQQTGAITENTRSWVANRLEQSGVLDAAKGLGIDLGQVTEAALGNADAIAYVTEALATLDAGLRDSEGYEINREQSDKVHEGTMLINDAIGATTGAIDDAKGRLPLLNEALGKTGDTAEVAATQIGEVEQALKRLNGVLDRREAVRNYRDAIDDFLKAIKDGEKTPRELADLLDNIARNAGQVAEGLAGADKRRYMVKARQDFIDLATKLYGSREAAVKLADKLFDLDKIAPKPKVEIDLGPLRAGIATANAWLNGIQDETVNLNIVKRGAAGAPSGAGPTRPDDPKRISVPRTSSRGGALTQTLLGRGASSEAINAGKTALALEMLKGSAEGAAGSAKGLKQRLKEAEKALDRETRKRDALVARRDAVSSSISSSITGDSLWATSEASSDPWAAGATAGGVMDPFAANEARKQIALRWIAALKALKKKGIKGAALEEIVTNGGLAGAEYMASSPQASLFAAEFASTQALVDQASNLGGNIAFGAQIADLGPGIRELTQTVKHLEHKLEMLSKDHKREGKKNAQETGWAVGREVNKSARAGLRRGRALTR